jgi:phosphoribosyl-ATP pyrophosphohydrolase
MIFGELKTLVLEWADERNLLHGKNKLKQYTKFGEEANELLRAILNENEEEIVDGIGDTLVTLIILSEQLGLDPEGCLERAYQEIKDRKGETVNGEFIKNK